MSVAQAAHQGLVFAIITLSGLAMARWGWRRAVYLRKPRAHQVWCTFCVVMSTLECATHTIVDVGWWFGLAGFVTGMAALTMSADVRYRR